MRPLAAALVVLAAVAALAPPAPALPPADDFVVYGEWSGRFAAGAPLVGIGSAPGSGVHGFDAVNLARHAFEADDCRRDVRVTLRFDPEALAADTPAAAVSVPHEFEARLANASTGEPLHAGALTWRAPGTFALTLDEPGGVEVELAMRRGVDVAYTLRVTGWRAFDAECRWQGRLFVNEVEANPAGADAGNEWIEILNAGFDDADLAGWAVRAEHGSPESLTLTEGTRVAAGERLIVAFADPFLDNVDETIVLQAPRGWIVDRTPPLTDAANDARSWQRAPDGAEAWAFATATRAVANG